MHCYCCASLRTLHCFVKLSISGKPRHKLRFTRRPSFPHAAEYSRVTIERWMGPTWSEHGRCLHALYMGSSLAHCAPSSMVKDASWRAPVVSICGVMDTGSLAGVADAVCSVYTVWCRCWSSDSQHFSDCPRVSACA